MPVTFAPGIASILLNAVVARTRRSHRGSVGLAAPNLGSRRVRVTQQRPIAATAQPYHANQPRIGSSGPTGT